MKRSIAAVSALSFFYGSSLECCEKLLNGQICCLCSSAEELSPETVKWHMDVAVTHGYMMLFYYQ